MNDFVKKYDGKPLQDAGAYVSKEYQAFQNAMKRDLKRMAGEIGAAMLWFSKGHYDQSAMFERNGHFAYMHYSGCIGDRSTPALRETMTCLCRTAAHEKDYKGGRNNHCSYVEVQATFNRLLNEVHTKAF